MPSLPVQHQLLTCTLEAQKERELLFLTNISEPNEVEVSHFQPVQLKEIKVLLDSERFQEKCGPTQGPPEGKC